MHKLQIRKNLNENQFGQSPDKPAQPKDSRLPKFLAKEWNQYILQAKATPTQRTPTFIISGSFHGPLLDLRHPPSVAHVQEPPKKSGS